MSEVESTPVLEEADQDKLLSEMEIKDLGIAPTVIEPVEMTRAEREVEEDLASWVPKTEVGKKVRSKEIKDIDEIINSGKKILEHQIVDSLLSLKTDLLDIGHARGKFGGGKRTTSRQTQKKTEDGNIPTFSVMAVVGDENGHIGVGKGRAKENLPAKDKSIKKAKINIQKVIRGCGSFDCSCNELHSIPTKVRGKCGSCEVTLIPAPQGTGLVAGDQIKKVLRLAGIKDVYSKTFGKTKTTPNLIKACLDALQKLNEARKE